MAKISLRDYDREIEHQIEAGHTDEAISHCRYILQKFPKHIDTYRLLGKAYLETKRYTDASDVLQRVLSSIPDDFVAHLGMSLIREDEGDLDAAIWHMERAFEAQPANAAIQNELRRLYGRRDGLEPPKVHLTRGALARMYAKGNLYRQAIAEIRTALAEDPQRPDLQVLLAQTYMETNQRVEAVEICSALLNKLPYCLVANRILAKVLPDTERASEAKIYRQHIQALEPYAAHLSPSSPTAEQVPDSAITLERYVWTPGEVMGGAPQPEWASTLGVEIGEEPQEAVPDWLSPGVEAAGEPEGAAPQEELELPDWLESDIEAPEEPKTPPPFLAEGEEEAISAEDLAPGEVPDWLRSMAPAPDMEEESAEGMMDDEQAGQEPVQPFEFEEEAPTEIPDWLRDMEAEAPEEIEQATTEL
ncbi:MAG: tetratricopeptide repeat protein, partial [Anaerolineales bacterium]